MFMLMISSKQVQGISYQRSEIMVEWKKIEDFGSYFGGLTGKTKDDFVDGNAKFITYMNVFANPSLDISSTGVVKINEGEKQNKIQFGDILFTGSSETPDEAGMSCVVANELDEDYYMNSFCFGIRLDNPKQYNLHYLKHVLRSNDVRKKISKSASGVTRFNISKARFGKIQIPIPSIEEQNRIVGILDTFTASIDNLKEQIAQRRKQYEYYRDQLLDLEGKEGVEMKTLGEICSKLTDGSHFSPRSVEHGYYMPSVKDMTNKGFDYSNCKQISKEDYESLIRTGCKPKIHDVLIAKDGSMLKYAFPVIKDEDIVILSSIAILTPRTKVITSAYLSHYLKCGKVKEKTIREYSSKGGVPRIILKNFKKICVCIPPLSEQQRIVSILDTFEASIQNLEAQLSQREKQYEYYRNKLLTFE